MQNHHQNSSNTKETITPSNYLRNKQKPAKGQSSNKHISTSSNQPFKKAASLLQLRDQKQQANILKKQDLNCSNGLSIDMQPKSPKFVSQSSFNPEEQFESQVPTEFQVKNTNKKPERSDSKILSHVKLCNDNSANKLFQPVLQQSSSNHSPTYGQYLASHSIERVNPNKSAPGAVGTHSRQESANRVSTYLEAMKVQYGNSTRNSLQPREANTESQYYENNQTDHDEILGKDQRSSLLNYSKLQNGPISLRASQTPNHSSSNKQIQSLGFFINPLTSTPYQNKEPQIIRERSESRTRRLQMMNENEKQAFLQECANIQDLVRNSVSNLNRLFDTSKDINSSNKLLRAKVTTHFSPGKQSFANADKLLIDSALKIQRFYKNKINKRKTIKILKRIKPFKARLLSIYKGYILRKKVLKNFIIRQLIKDIKSLKTKQSQSAYINMKSNSNNNKQQIIKNQLRDKIGLLIEKVNDYISNKKYMLSKQRFSQGHFSKNTKKNSNNQISPRKSELVQSQRRPQSQLEESSNYIQPSKRLQQKSSKALISPNHYQKHLIDHCTSLIENETSIDYRNSLHDQIDEKEIQQAIGLCNTSIDQNPHQQSPKGHFLSQDQRKLESAELLNRDAGGSRLNNTLTDKKPFQRYSMINKQDKSLNQSKTISSQKQKSILSPKETELQNNLTNPRRHSNSKTRVTTNNKNYINKQDTSLVVAKEKYLNGDLEVIESFNRRENSKNKTAANVQTKVDCWRKNDNTVKFSNHQAQNKSPIPRVGTATAAGNHQQQVTDTSEEIISASQDYYEQIINQMRKVMQDLKCINNCNKQSIQKESKELKMKLERCFIDMRREFDIICLEKSNETNNDAHQSQKQ